MASYSPYSYSLAEPLVRLNTTVTTPPYLHNLQNPSHFFMAHIDHCRWLVREHQVFVMMLRSRQTDDQGPGEGTTDTRD